MTSQSSRRRSSRTWISVGLNRLSAALLLALLAGSACGDRNFSGEDRSAWFASRPDLIVILVDTLRRDYLGTYGFQGEISPALDRFANESVLFENAISAAPWTLPSVASIFTSLYPEEHGMRRIAAPRVKRRPAKSEASKHPRFSVLNEGIPTLAETLREAGYETAAFYTNAWLVPETGLGRGFEHYTRVEDDAKRITSQALDFMRRRERTRPLFLYLHFMDVHGPY